jgi:hypothetical protein
VDEDAALRGGEFDRGSFSTSAAVSRNRKRLSSESRSL